MVGVATLNRKKKALCPRRRGQVLPEFLFVAELLVCGLCKGFGYRGIVVTIVRYSFVYFRFPDTQPGALWRLWGREVMGMIGSRLSFGFIPKVFPHSPVVAPPRLIVIRYFHGKIAYGSLEF